MTYLSKYLFSLLVCFMVFISACTKEEIVPDHSEPVFATGAFSGDREIFSINAGENDFFMFTDIPVLAVSKNTIYSRLAKSSDCRSQCSESFELRVDLGEHFMEDQRSLSLPVNEEPVGSGNNQSKYGFFFNNFSDVDHSIEWSYVEIDTEISDSIYVGVSDAMVANLDPIVVHISDIVELKIVPRLFADNGSMCGFRIVGSRDSTNMVSSLKIESENAMEIIWNNGTVGDEIVVDESFAVLSASLIFANGCAMEIGIEIKDTENIDKIDFAMEINKIDSPAVDLLPVVVITYVDPNGQIYVSRNDGSIQISNAEDFGINDIGLPTWKYDLSYAAKLYNIFDENDFIDITKGTAVLATLAQ